MHGKLTVPNNRLVIPSKEVMGPEIIPVGLFDHTFRKVTNRDRRRYGNRLYERKYWARYFEWTSQIYDTPGGMIDFELKSSLLDSLSGAYYSKMICLGVYPIKRRNFFDKVLEFFGHQNPELFEDELYLSGGLIKHDLDLDTITAADYRRAKEKVHPEKTVRLGADYRSEHYGTEKLRMIEDIHGNRFKNIIRTIIPRIRLVRSDYSRAELNDEEFEEEKNAFYELLQKAFDVYGIEESFLPKLLLEREQ